VEDFSEVKEFFEKLIKEKIKRTRKPKFDLKETYLSRLGDLPGSKIFQNTFFKVENELIDFTKGGALSCAAVVSNFLFMFNKYPDFIWIKNAHVTVESILTDLKECGWHEVIDFRLGSVLIWEPKFKISDGQDHRNVGFKWVGNLAISNDPDGNIPIFHDLYFYGTRNVEKIFWHHALNY